MQKKKKSKLKIHKQIGEPGVWGVQLLHEKVSGVFLMVRSNTLYKTSSEKVVYN